MKTLDELAALIEQQGAENKQRTAEVVASVKTLTDEVQVHATQLRELREARANDQQRMTTLEASHSMLGGQVRGVSETASRIEAETKNQSSILQELRDDKIARDERAKVMQEVEEKSTKREGKLTNRVGIVIGLVSLMLAAIGTLAAVEVHRSRSEPPAAIAPAH